LDGDEGFALIVAAIGAIVFVVRWYRGLVTITMVGAGWRGRVLLGITPVVCLGGLQFFLLRYAAHEVREKGVYDALFLTGGIAWLCVTDWILKLSGLNVRDDAIEMRNPAVVAAACGAIVGMTICYGAANVGEGPTIWTTFVPAFLATAVIGSSLMMATAATRMDDSIAIDRDTASGLRVGGFMVAIGLVLGRAVAGDWHSWDGMVWDFLAIGWPAVVFMVELAAMQMMWRPTMEQPRRGVWKYGIVPAVSMIILALGWVRLTVVTHMGGH
jgi:hypothetical protein